MTHFRLRIDGSPTGKGRPRHVRATGRVYTPAATVAAEDRVRSAWLAAGSPRIDGPLILTVALYVARPRAHLTTKGTLSAAGKRAPVPVRKPDLDNAAKLLMDSLNGCAFRDDVDVVSLSVTREWAEGDHERTVVQGWAAARYLFCGMVTGSGVRAVTPHVERAA